MGCGCEKDKAKKECNDFTKAVINIENPEVLTLFHKVVIPASMGDEEAVPPAIGKYCNTLLYYEASGNAYLYSSDGIPTLLTSEGPQGPQGEQGEPGPEGPEGPEGPAGRDGVIQYTAGTGINIDANNVISATGSAAVAWGDINGTLANQTDLQNALNAKQGTLTAGSNVQINGNTISATDTTYTAGANINIDANNVISATDTTYNNFVGTDGQTAGTQGLVPAPATTDDGKYLKADGTWATVAGGGSTITLTDTDPGEGSALAADNFIGVYGIDAFNGDYATAEAATGTKWIDGKEIYKKTYYISALPNNGSGTYNPGISNLDYVVKIEAFGLRSSDTATFPLPFSHPTSANCISLTYVKSTGLINIATGVDRSLLSAYVTIYYTKTV